MTTAPINNMIVRSRVELASTPNGASAD
jgi:hypothetical protein